MLRSIFYVVLASLLWPTLASAQCSCAGPFQLTGGSSNLSIANGQTYCLVSGTFTGNLDISSGGKICVSSGATLNPGNMNTFAGTVENYGTFIPQFGLSLSSGALIDNRGTMTINSSINFNGAATIINRSSATFNLNTSFSLNNGSYFKNYGKTFSGGAGADFSSSSTSIIDNYGELRITGGNFNPAGPTNNYGMFYSANQININGGPIANYCRFVTVKGFNLNSNTFTNDGLIWSTSASAGEGIIQINGGATFSNTAAGQLRGKDFTNNGTVNGFGQFYFTGATTQQGTFAGSSSGSPIEFYDASQTASQKFDNNGSSSNTIRPASMTAGDTATWGTCDSWYYQTVYNMHTSLSITAAPLPVTLTSFEGSEDGMGNTWLSWTTLNESRLSHFELERSGNGKDYQRIATVGAAGGTALRQYRTVDEGTNTSDRFYRLKMVDADGRFAYSKTLFFRPGNTTNETEIVVAPNPMNGPAVMSFNATVSGPAVAILHDVTGRVVRNIEVYLSAGKNSLQLQGTETLPAGVYHLSLLQDGRELAKSVRISKI